ncbi:HK97 family phage prohead protease [Hyphococcus flavus]|uniref:HK97 family phage prohead protease n=1 Tax=Hyphococcus flavus TaxID=1866326 RepID=A0AAF0CGG5_9PROT|nr:HK97 family phage prohead protease [Hyphococcus flavus]WDI32158.1 HK97 family phage prohead protease [Hyphococcus flavus]
MNNNCFVADIEGYAAVFNTPDLNGDVIAPGAFTQSLRASGAVRMLYQHAAETPIGRWVSFQQDGYGLFVTGEILLSSPRAREVHALLSGGAIDGLSIGYQTRRAQKIKAGRRITEAELWEVSIVTFPMAPKARILRVGPARAEYGAQDYADAFTQSVCAPRPPSPQGAQTAGWTPRSSPPEPGVQPLADAFRAATNILSV